MVQESIKHFPIPLRKSFKVIAEGDFLDKPLWRNVFPTTLPVAGVLAVTALFNFDIPLLQSGFGSTFRGWWGAELIGLLAAGVGNALLSGTLGQHPGKDKNAFAWLEQNVPELKDKILATLCMEGNIPEFEGDDAQDANVKGGLGFYFGDKLEGLFDIGIKAYGFQAGWLYRKKDGKLIKVDYAELKRRGILKQVYAEDGKPLVVGVYAWDSTGPHNPENNPLIDVEVWQVNRGGTADFILLSSVFDCLYTDNRAHRFTQEIVFGRTVYQILKRLNIIPDIMHLNEAHTVVAAAQARADQDFAKMAIVYTVHTTVPAGLEIFDAGALKTNVNRMMYQIGIPETKKSQFRSKFLRPNGVVDFCYAALNLSDVINAVSDECAITAKQLFKRMYGKDVDVQVIPVLNGSGKSWKADRLSSLEDKGIIPAEDELWGIFEESQSTAYAEVEARTSVKLDPHKPTVWVVRRIVEYKSQYPILRFLVHLMCAERTQSFSRQQLKEAWGRDILPFIDDKEWQRIYNHNLNEIMEKVLDGLFESTDVVYGLGMQVVVGGLEYEKFWVQEFKRWSNIPELKGKFVYVPEPDMKLLKMQAIGADICINTPRPLEEASGTSDKRSGSNGGVNVPLRGAGFAEWLTDYDEKTGKGSGFLFGPYTKSTLNRFILQDAFEDGDIDYLKSLAETKYQVSEGNERLFITKGRQDLIEEAVLLSRQIAKLANVYVQHSRHLERLKKLFQETYKVNIIVSKKDVALSDLLSLRSQVKRSKVEGMVEKFREREFDPIIGIRYGEEVVILDGTHRSIAARILSRKVIPAYVLSPERPIHLRLGEALPLDKVSLNKEIPFSLIKKKNVDLINKGIREKGINLSVMGEILGYFAVFRQDPEIVAKNLEIAGKLDAQSFRQFLLNYGYVLAETESKVREIVEQLELEALPEASPFSIIYKDGKFEISMRDLPGWGEDEDYLEQKRNSRYYESYFGRTSNDHEAVLRLHQDRSRYTTGINLANLLDGEDMLIIGPGGDLGETLFFIQNYPSLRKAVIIDWYKKNIKDIFRQLSVQPEEIKAKVELYCLDIRRRTPFENNRFTCVYRQNVLVGQLFSINALTNAWQEIHRIMKSGGVFLGLATPIKFIYQNFESIQELYNLGVVLAIKKQDKTDIAMRPESGGLPISGSSGSSIPSDGMEQTNGRMRRHHIDHELSGFGFGEVDRAFSRGHPQRGGGVADNNGQKATEEKYAPLHSQLFHKEIVGRRYLSDIENLITWLHILSLKLKALIRPTIQLQIEKLEKERAELVGNLKALIEENKSILQAEELSPEVKSLIQAAFDLFASLETKELENKLDQAKSILSEAAQRLNKELEQLEDKRLLEAKRKGKKAKVVTITTATGEELVARTLSSLGIRFREGKVYVPQMVFMRDPETNELVQVWRRIPVKDLPAVLRRYVHIQESIALRISRLTNLHNTLNPRIKEIEQLRDNLGFLRYMLRKIGLEEMQRLEDAFSKMLVEDTQWVANLNPENRALALKAILAPFAQNKPSVDAIVQHYAVIMNQLRQKLNPFGNLLGNTPPKGVPVERFIGKGQQPDSRGRDEAPHNNIEKAVGDLGAPEAGETSRLQQETEMGQAFDSSI